MEKYINFSRFLFSQYDFIKDHIDTLSAFLIQQKSVGLEYLEQNKSQKDLPFNVFTIASDFYYRENFHSDIISAFLDTTNKHGERAIFLEVLIDLLNKYYHRHISKFDYKNATAVREFGGIDILIQSFETKHCIIIENKIYNATDMSRQLPRYYDFMINQGFMVDAIVYLPLEKSKFPDESDWTQEDKDHINPLLCILPAYTKDRNVNFVDGWILPCTLATNNINCISILKQYADLVKQLNNNVMNSVILEKFYASLLENKENADSAKAIYEMVGNLPVFMADRLVDRLKNYNTHFKVWKWKPNFCGFIFHINGTEYKIDIWTSINGYDAYVFEQSGNGDMNILDGKIILKDFNLIGQDNRNYRYFGFGEENVLIDWIEQSIDEIQSFCD